MKKTTKKSKEVPKTTCQQCKGTGRFPHSEITCDKCDGSGK